MAATENGSQSGELRGNLPKVTVNHRLEIRNARGDVVGSEELADSKHKEELGFLAQRSIFERMRPGFGFFIESIEILFIQDRDTSNAEFSIRARLTTIVPLKGEREQIDVEEEVRACDPNSPLNDEDRETVESLNRKLLLNIRRKIDDFQRLCDEADLLVQRLNTAFPIQPWMT